ncbi:hypothetical protein Fot_28634 [Forsythia ovata]|uniref:Uncharacterized protein n=1 Tax=Forsythia ovata TaxID=205694 RepID=A0ABD1TPK0_9LAMI
MVSSFSFILLAPEMTSGVPSILFFMGPVSPSKIFGRPGKRKTAANSKEELFAPGKGMDGAGGFRITRRGYRDPTLETEDRTPNDRGASRTPIPPAGRHEYINIGSHWDELDPMILGRLLAPAAIAVASVHKYWTSAFGKATDDAELPELLKLAEMYTLRSHVLKCELYKNSGDEG